MKRVFIASFMYAPKATGKTGGNQSTTPENDQANENKGGEPKTDEPAGGEVDKGADEPANDDKKADVAAEPTSEKLTAIRADIDGLLEKVTVETDRKKKLELIGDLQKKQAEEQTEINAIKKALLDAQIQEKKNAKIALVTNYEAAVLAEYVFQIGDYAKAGEGLPPETPNPLMDTMNEFTDAKKAAYETLVNQLLGTVSVKASGEGQATTGTKGETAKAIIAAYEKYIAAGQDDTTARKSVIAEGYSRGTTGAVVLAYRQEKGLA